MDQKINPLKKGPLKFLYPAVKPSKSQKSTGKKRIWKFEIFTVQNLMPSRDPCFERSKFRIFINFFLPVDSWDSEERFAAWYKIFSKKILLWSLISYGNNNVILA